MQEIDDAACALAVAGADVAEAHALAPESGYLRQNRAIERLHQGIIRGIEDALKATVHVRTVPRVQKLPVRLANRPHVLRGTLRQPASTAPRVARRAM